MANYAGYTYNKLQLGRETTPGTAVAATAIWRGPYGDIEDARERSIAEEQIGLLVPAERLYDTRVAALLTMPETELTFEQLPHILEAGIKTVTPTGTAAPYTYTYPFPVTTTPNTIKTYTIEAGNAYVTGDIREMEYSFVEGFTLSGSQGEAWMMAANWRGRQITEAAFTAALQVPQVEEAIFSKTTLDIDDTGAAFGTTNKPGVLVAANIEVDTGVRPVWVGDGQLYFLAHKFHAPSLTFSLTLELESAGIFKAERDAFEAKTLRLIYLECPGTASRSLRISFPAKYDSVGSYQNSDGNTTVELTGHAVYDSVTASFAQFDILNTLANL